ncbi:uncharacterized protein BKCO1_3000113 [Diplodia corticola]|uniref:Uncharacterized protein n=1 Tax=Diplodia corticola TaxID=236234 RepID=A0A1J9SEU1_9PEZI|nr:uncharacterized protein BKCO1_3000113 [Diplodia corticola]OJD38927.1 hypothetical protein BKCO1_3000113 [Diplodia corticola]
MNCRGSARYIPRYDNHQPPVQAEDDAVGDLDFDIVFPHSHNQQQQQQQQQQHRGDQPHVLPPAPVTNPAPLGGLDPQELRQFGIRVPGEDDHDADDDDDDDDTTDDDEQLIFDFDLEDDSQIDHYHYRRSRSRRRRQLLPALPPPREEWLGEEADPEEDIAWHGPQRVADLTGQVARQQRYVDNVRAQLRFGPHAPADGGVEGWRRELRRAEDALRGLRETLRVATGVERGGRNEGGAAVLRRGVGDVVGNAEGDGDDKANGYSGDDEGRRRAGTEAGQEGHGRRRRGGLDPRRRREIELELAELRDMEAQLQWGGAAPEELRHVAAEMDILQSILDGRYAAAWGRDGDEDTRRSPSPSSPSPSSPSSSPASGSTTTITSFSSPDHHHRGRRRHRRHHKRNHHRTPPARPPPDYHHPLPPPHIPHTSSPTPLHDA